MTWTTVSGSTEDSTSNLINKDEPRAPSAVVGRGGMEIVGNGEVVHDYNGSYTIGQEAPVDDSIMSTVKASHGGQIIGRSPNGNDIISIGGMTTSISAAVAAGLLVRNQDGTFSDKDAL